MTLGQMPPIRNQTNRITGMLAYPEANKIISVSDQGTLLVSELTTGDELQTLYPVYPYTYALKTLIDLPERGCIIASDSIGKIFIWSHDPTVQLIAQLESKSLSEIRGVTAASNLLCVGQIDGTVTLYDIGAPGKEKFTKLVTSWQGKNGIRLLAMRDKPRREVITGDNTGIITVFDLKTQQPVHVLQAHTDVITQMKWLEDQQMLITCAKDKSLKFWKFPQKWIDESNVQQAVGVVAEESSSESSDEEQTAAESM